MTHASDEDPLEVPGLPDTEDVDLSDAPERLEESPDEQVNRPDQATPDPDRDDRTS